MKQWIAYIFLMVFSFQVLPVKELGKLLFKGQMTEEVHPETDDMDGDGPDPDLKLKKEAEHFSIGQGFIEYTPSVQYLTGRILIALHLAESIPLQFIPDILTPPPNRL